MMTSRDDLRFVTAVSSRGHPVYPARIGMPAFTGRFRLSAMGSNISLQENADEDIEEKPICGRCRDRSGGLGKRSRCNAPGSALDEGFGAGCERGRRVLLFGENHRGVLPPVVRLEAREA